MIPAALLVAVLGTAATGPRQLHISHNASWHEEYPTRVFRFLPLGGQDTLQCASIAQGAAGEALTFTRATAAACTKSDGTVVTLTSGNPGVEPAGYLGEPASTNLLVQSETMDNGSHQKWFVTVTADAAVAPDGTTTADKIVEDGTTNRHTLFTLYTTAAIGRTASVYAKSAGRTFANLAAIDDSGSKGVIFNLTTCAVATNLDAVGNTSFSATPSVNGWCRLSVGRSTTLSGADDWEVGPALNGTTASYAGDSSSGIYVWGGQAEQTLDRTTSYIKTVGTTVTRNATQLTWPWGVAAGSDFSISETVCFPYSNVVMGPLTPEAFDVALAGSERFRFNYGSNVATKWRCSYSNGADGPADSWSAGACRRLVASWKDSTATGTCSVYDASTKVQIGASWTFVGLGSITDAATMFIGSLSSASRQVGYVRELSVYSTATGAQP